MWGFRGMPHSADQVAESGNSVQFTNLIHTMKGKLVGILVSAAFVLAVVAIAFRVTTIRNFVTNQPAA